MDLFVQLAPKAETLVYHLLRNACFKIKQDIGHITEYKLVWVMTCENTYFQMVRRKRNQKSETQWNNNNNNNRLIQQLRICRSSPVEWKSFIAATRKIIIQCVSYWSWVYAINQQRDKIKENNAVCIFVAKILGYLIATDNSPHDQKNNNIRIYTLHTHKKAAQWLHCTQHKICTVTQSLLMCLPGDFFL